MIRNSRKSTKNKAKSRRPGRPGGVEHTEATRAALLKASRELFARRDFKAVSVRDIAAAAGVNPAMVHYHFGDKQGLYRAMLEETIGPMIAQVQGLAERPEEVTPDTFRRLMGGVMMMFAREHWVAPLIVREVLAEEGPFRETFIREFATRGGGRVPALLRAGMETGRVRRDLDPMLGGLSFMSLVLFPFFARPVAEKVFGIRMNETVARRLAEHSARLYFDGIGTRAPPRTQTASPAPTK